MKCRDCDCCRRGFFTSRPEKYVCTGVREPFVIDDIDRQCTEYGDRNDGSETKHSKKTLMGYTKDILSDMVLLAEHNEKTAMEQLEQQAKNLKGWRPVVRCGECVRKPLCVHHVCGEHALAAEQYRGDDFCSRGVRHDKGVK